MNIDEIKNTIKQLESGPTTFDACSKLASLYVIIDKLEDNPMNISKSTESDVVKEYQDILPGYNHYCEQKRMYQIGQIGKEQVILSFESLCDEIKEFMQTLYANTETPDERTTFANTIIETINLFEGY